MRIAHEPALLKRRNPNQARLLCHIETILFQAEAIRTCLCFPGHKPLCLKEFLVNRPVTTKRMSKQPPAAGSNVRTSGFEKMNRETGWCALWDSNPHSRRMGILSPLCLPFHQAREPSGCLSGIHAHSATTPCVIVGKLCISIRQKRGVNRAGVDLADLAGRCCAASDATAHRRNPC
jgi:hypothetical protein